MRVGLLSVALVGLVVLGNAPAVKADGYGPSCRKLERLILKKQAKGQRISDKLIARYQYACGGGSQSSTQNGYQGQGGYGYQDGYTYQNQGGSTYQNQNGYANQGGYGYQTQNGYPGYGSEVYQSGGYAQPGYAGPGATIVTPNSQVQIQRRNMQVVTPLGGINLNF
jgi:hypothetical protein